MKHLAWLFAVAASFSTASAQESLAVFDAAMVVALPVISSSAL